MNVEDIKQFYKVKKNTEVAKLLFRSKGTITNWTRKGIPESEQALIELRTGGKLKADIENLDRGRKND